jgi:uncharacterized membrane protein
MPTLTVCEFDRLHGAGEVLQEKVEKLHDPTRAGVVSGGFRGMLFDLLFLTRLLGMVISAASSPLLGSMRDVGIGADLIREVRNDARA